MTHTRPTPEGDANAVPSSRDQRSRDSIGEPVADEAVATMLGRIPSGLFVVTWREDSADRGMLASWIMQAGFRPPMVTIAVASSRDLLAAIERGVPFVVNVLGESQRPLLARFSRPAGAGDDPFAGLTVERTPGGTAAIGGGVGWMECRAAGTIGEPHDGGVAAGDHAVVLAAITAASTGPASAPLVHLRRNGLRY
jgi:hypothetical protein